ncbi:MAG: 23S rRNA (uracil(1939)-C(5))-methyltransferase RlmD [Candidatus Binatia bacterium]
MTTAAAPPAPSDSSLPCRHFPNCAGCALIGRPYGTQLAAKRRQVIEALGSFPALARLDVPPVIGSPRAFGYRNQAKLVVRRTRRGLLLGIYRPGSHQVVDIRQCPVHHPLVMQAIEAVARVVERYDIPTYDERSRAGILRYVIIRGSHWTKTVQVILVTRDRLLPHARNIVRSLLRVRGVRSIVQNINPKPGNAIFGPAFVPLTHETALIERIGFVKLKTRAGAFLQANVAVARKLYAHALQQAALDATGRAIDLYCGVGGLTFYLATTAKHVAGIEASAIAIADAKENIRLNGFHNVRFYCGTVAAALPAIAQGLGRLDVMTLNPPRKGVDTSARTAIVRAAPKRIVYISCDPGTLARDLDWFAAQGYRPAHLQPFDLLPQTEHVECVATLEDAREEHRMPARRPSFRP